VVVVAWWGGRFDDVVGVWCAGEVTERRRVLSGAALVVAVVLVAFFIERRSGPHRGQIGSASIVMLGDSITEQAAWGELLPDLDVVNEGHSGYTTEQLVPIADSIGDARPRVVFVLTGTNDIRDGRSPEWTAEQLRRLLDSLERRSPETIVIVQTVLPRADQPAAVEATNDAIRTVAASRGVRVLELHGSFDDGAGGLRPDETTDGIHLSSSGYRRWASLLAAEIENLGVAADAEA
jgi:lysophospholipase L1-like esterase